MKVLSKVIFCFLLSFPVLGSSQSLETDSVLLTGKIVEENNASAGGIFIKINNEEFRTDKDGSFNYYVKKGECVTLSIDMIGYSKMKILNINTDLETVNLDEIVILDYSSHFATYDCGPFNFICKVREKRYRNGFEWERDSKKKKKYLIKKGYQWNGKILEMRLDSNKEYLLIDFENIYPN